jgi:hypothetical protein
MTSEASVGLKKQKRNITDSSIKSVSTQIYIDKAILTDGSYATSEW